MGTPNVITKDENEHTFFLLARGLNTYKASPQHAPETNFGAH